MKNAILVLSTLLSINAFAGGSSYHCTSKDGNTVFSGSQTDSVDGVSVIYPQNITDDKGNVLGVSKTIVSAGYSQGKNLPDFGEPIASKDSVDSVMDTVKALALKDKDPNMDTYFVLGMGTPKMLFSKEESHCRDVGDFVFEQEFAIITAKYAPWAKALPNYPYDIGKKVEKFVCVSSYATTTGGRCQDLKD